MRVALDRDDRDVAFAPRTQRECCAKAENLTTIERTDHVQVRRCQVCGLRHFRAILNMTAPGVTVEGLV